MDHLKNDLPTNLNFRKNFFGSEKKLILSTEHGPKGGDEINKSFLIKITDGQFHLMEKHMHPLEKKTRN